MTINLPGTHASGFRPDVVVLIGTAEEVFEMVLKNTQITGERITSSMSGVGAMCGECTVLPLVTGKPNVSVGCGGSRRGVALGEGELFLAMPFDTFEKLETKEL